MANPRFSKIKSLGAGGQGANWLVRCKSTGQHLVRKTFEDWVMVEGKPYEAYILSKVLPEHPRILRLYHMGYGFPEGRSGRQKLEMYFEFCQGGDLTSFVNVVKDGYLEEPFIWHVFISLADALAMLHYGYDRKAKNPDKPPSSKWRPVVHGDVKTENVFCRSRWAPGKDWPSLVLGDFGLATLEATTYGGGTYDYQGPEVGTMTAAGDIWGLGAIIHELCHGQPPMKPFQGGNRMAWLLDPQARNPRELPECYTQELNNNMMSCLKLDPKKRINSRDLVRQLQRDIGS